ncbi:MAG: hypothetical protein Tsb009_04670 [Planctomycetaceae bacterium]
MKKYDLVTCKVYTPETGFSLLIDGHPVRDQDDNWLKTPCQVNVPRGTHQFTVAKAGFQDTHLTANITQEGQEVDFPKSLQATPDDKSILDAAYLQSKPGEPIPLFTLNTPSRELDPSISPDGTLLYFVSDRDGVNAIYYVARPTAYSYFEQKPIRIESSRGSDLPASPTLSADHLSIVYTIPQYGMIIALSRETPVGKFLRKTTLKSRTRPRGIWFAAQTIRENNNAWWLYWTQRESGKNQTMVATSKQKRASTSDEVSRTNGEQSKTVLAPLADQKFSQPASFDLEGVPPCLSQDGLRQYNFDGNTLSRAVRANLEQPFSKYVPIAKFNIANYQPTPNRRSYFLTDDEQWLFYENRGDLFMLRVADKKRIGYVARGESIPQRIKVAKVPMTKRKAPVDVPPTKPQKKQIDPRKIPLPYPEFRQQFKKLVGKRNYSIARKLAQTALKEKRLQKDQNLIRWDLEDLDRIIAFWQDVRTALKSYKPDDVIRIGNARLKFVSFKNDVLATNALNKTVNRNILEMRPGDLSSIVTSHFGRKDPSHQIRIGTFLYYDNDGKEAAAAIYFRRAGKAGERIFDQIPARRIQQARHEYARGNVSTGLFIARNVLEKYPKSKAADDAKSLTEEAYSRTKWVSVGRRKWTMSNGTYTATNEKSPGSILRSPDKVRNFELRLEWKSDVLRGQGGVFFRYPGSGDLTETAFKIQLSDDFGIPADNYCTGSLFKIAAPTINAVRKRGEWNSLILRVKGESVKAMINGRTVLETKATSETIPKNGYVALDGTLGGITYRRTLLIELPDDE